MIVDSLGSWAWAWDPWGLFPDLRVSGLWGCKLGLGPKRISALRNHAASGSILDHARCEDVVGRRASREALGFAGGPELSEGLGLRVLLSSFFRHRLVENVGMAARKQNNETPVLDTNRCTKPLLRVTSAAFCLTHHDSQAAYRKHA